MTDPSPALGIHLDGIARQDRRAFEALYTATAPSLFGLILSVLSGVPDGRTRAESALESAALRIWEDADSFSVSGLSPMAWLLTQARAAALAERRAGPDSMPSDAGYPGAIDLTADPGPVGTSQPAPGDGLGQILSTLPDDQADALRAVYLGGAGIDDLAGGLEMTAPDTRAWLGRALIRVRAGMGAATAACDDGLRVLAAEWALGVLPPDEAGAVAIRLETDTALQAEVTLWTELLATMAAHSVEPVTPPPRAARAIRHRLFGGAGRSFVARLGLVPATLGAIAASGLLWVAVTYDLLLTEEPVVLLATTIQTDLRPLGVAFLDTGRLVIAAAPTPSAGKHIAVWMKRSSEPIVYIGNLTPDQVTELPLPSNIALLPAETEIWLSVEDQDQPETRQPSNTILGTGRLSAL